MVTFKPYVKLICCIIIFVALIVGDNIIVVDSGVVVCSIKAVVTARVVVDTCGMVVVAELGVTVDVLEERLVAVDVVIS